MLGILKAVALSEKYPGNLGIIFRKNFTDLRDSTMADYTKYTGRKVRMSDKSDTYPNGSKILFHHLDELAGVAQNINLGWFMIEQAEEFDNDVVFQTLRGRLRRENVSEHCGFLIANTNGHNWIWRLWKQETLANADLFESVPFDNPHLPAAFFEDLKQMETESPSHYRRFVLNSWEDTDTSDRLFKYQHLLDSLGRDVRDYGGSMKVISCDPAEFGDDKTVIYVFEGLKVVERVVTAKKEPMDTAGRIVKLHRKYGADKIVVDKVGIGSGVASSLRETLDPHQDQDLIFGFNSGSLPRDRSKYVRARDEAFGEAARWVNDGYVSLLPDDDILVEDLAAHTYSLNSKGQILVARKRDIKKELGRSPDRADALVMGLWASKKGKKRELVGVQSKDEESDDYDPLTWEL